MAADYDLSASADAIVHAQEAHALGLEAQRVVFAMQGLLQQRMVDLEQRMEAAELLIRRLQAEMDLMHMRLRNVVAGALGPLDGPGGRIPDHLPNTRDRFKSGTEEECDALGAYLKLDFPQGMAFKKRQEHIANYLGVAL